MDACCTAAREAKCLLGTTWGRNTKKKWMGSNNDRKGGGQTGGARCSVAEKTAESSRGVSNETISQLLRRGGGGGTKGEPLRAQQATRRQAAFGCWHRIGGEVKKHVRRGTSAAPSCVVTQHLLYPPLIPSPRPIHVAYPPRARRCSGPQ